MEKCEVIKGSLARVSNSNRAGGTAGCYPIESRMMQCMDFLCPLMLAAAIHHLETGQAPDITWRIVWISLPVTHLGLTAVYKYPCRSAANFQVVHGGTEKLSPFSISRTLDFLPPSLHPHKTLLDIAYPEPGPSSPEPIVRYLAVKHGEYHPLGHIKWTVSAPDDDVCWSAVP